MTVSWNWPGSRWWKIDLHAHTFASYDFMPEEDRNAKDWKKWVEAARDAGLHAIAVTDHNTSAGIDPLKSAAVEVEGAPVIFPGVELTACDGTHLLFIFDPVCAASHVDDLLSKAHVPVDSRGEQAARSSLSVEQLFDIGGDDVLVIGAHINKPSGLLEHDGQQRIKELCHRRLLAAEVEPVPAFPTDTTWLDGSRPEIKRVIPQLHGSDSHRLAEMGRRFTWVKMTTPNIEGLRLSLLDGNASLQLASSDPNRHASCVIESVSVSKAKFMGRQSPLKIQFNPWLSSIIGGRGAGKSTAVDLIRAALRRENELGEKDKDSLRDAYEKRVRVPTGRMDEGLLTPDTVVEVLYRKDGERFVVTWDQQGIVPAIVRCEKNERVIEEGDVWERFPVRIYSQKQLFQLALDPDALLTVIDDSEEVRGVELRRTLKELENRYLSLRADARSLRASASNIPGRKAILEDVKRKLLLLQQGGHAQVLGEYRKRRRLDGFWSAIVETTMEGIERVSQSVEELAAADIDLGGEQEDTPGIRALLNAHSATRAVVMDLQSVVVQKIADTKTTIETILAGADMAVWRETVHASESAFQEVSEQLESAGIGSPDEYRELLERAASLETEIAGLEKQRANAETIDKEAKNVLSRYRETRKSLTARRKSLISNSTSELIRVDVEYCGSCSTETIKQFLRGVLGFSAKFEEDYHSLANQISTNQQPWSYESLDAIIQKMNAFVSDERQGWSVKDHRFANALQKTQPERLDRLALFLPEDSVSVKFKEPTSSGAWRPIEQGSAGQKTAALLAFVLGYGKEPIILDQPEDDLDNTLIYGLVVRRLRETKSERQIIVVTHNPNVVVHGDAEQIVSLVPGGGTTHIGCEGGLQERKVRDEICRVMEGGAQAFEMRYRRIMKSGDSTHE